MRHPKHGIAAQRLSARLPFGMAPPCSAAPFFTAAGRRSGSRACRSGQTPSGCIRPAARASPPTRRPSSRTCGRTGRKPGQPHPPRPRQSGGPFLQAPPPAALAKRPIPSIYPRCKLCRQRLDRSRPAPGRRHSPLISKALSTPPGQCRLGQAMPSPARPPARNILPKHRSA
jgi:hypothetical protein